MLRLTETNRDYNQVATGALNLYKIKMHQIEKTNESLLEVLLVLSGVLYTRTLWEITIENVNIAEMDIYSFIHCSFTFATIVH